jgi:hypothetical protein
MLIILSNRGHEIQVDDQDFAWLNQSRWYYHKYVLRYEGPQGFRTIVRLAREVLAHKLNRTLLPWPQELAEHEDRNTLNNQRYNLRVATYSQNQANKIKLPGVHTSQYLGVSATGRVITPWVADIRFQGQLFQKSFATELEAALWYDQMARQLHGEFARTNFE